MYNVKFGGKNGETVQLVESPDLVAIRTEKNQKLEDVSLTPHSRETLEGNKEVAEFPEAGVTVRRMPDQNAALGLESAPNLIARRDAVRASLKKEDDIRFAGRVLQDAKKAGR